jgi:O-antigen/teichoic acid export membrane protein
MSLPRLATAWAPLWAGGGPTLAAASPERRDRLGERGTFLAFVLAVGTTNVASLAGNAFVFRWVDPASMGVWHTLLLASSYLMVARLGVVNGMGRELPFALGRGDLDGARRIAATSLSYSVVCSVVVGLSFLVPLLVLRPSEPTWRLALPTIAVVSAANLYLAFLQATFRSDSDFAHLARVYWLQAAISLLLPVLVYTLGFPGLCLHSALQAVVVTAFAHAIRPLRVPARFEPQVARQLLATGMPLFLAGYLQVLAAGFDRVILLHRGGVAAVGYYAPAVAVLAALGIVPGAVATYVYPRMSYALGHGRSEGSLGRMALSAAAVSVLAGLPVAAAGWLVAPSVIERFFPQYVASIGAVRWSLVSGLVWSLSPATMVLGSLKAWRSLAFYVCLLLVTRSACPWVLSRAGDPLEGVARGNLLAAVLVGAVSLVLVRQAAAPRTPEGLS